MGNADAHWSRATINLALTSVIGWHPSLLQIPVLSHFGIRGTISITDWCTYPGSCTPPQYLLNLQPTYTMGKSVSILNILEYCLMKQNQLKFQNRNSLHVNEPMDNSAKIEVPLQPLTNPPLCITAIYAKDKAENAHWCSLQIGNTCSATIPMPITSNLWILISTTESDSKRITLIYPDQAPKSITVQKPIHVLHLPPACSAHLNISIYHPAMRIIRWQSTYHSIWLI